MKLIIGLGNPGEKYKNNRHNIGFLVLEKLKTEITNFQLPITNQFQNPNFQIKNKTKSEILKVRDLILAKPLTFMNSSGEAVKKLVDQYKVNLSNLWVIHDDLDIPLGGYKIQKGVGPKVHNGISSINNALSDTDYNRVRIGVDNRDPNTRIPGEKYVLEDFYEEERKILDGVIQKAIKDLENNVSS